jgi:hypothetical protein
MRRVSDRGTERARSKAAGLVLRGRCSPAQPTAKGVRTVPFFVYEVPAIKHREERNWEDEQQAKTALKHVARRAVQSGATKEDTLVVSLRSGGNKIYEGTVADALKPA